LETRNKTWYFIFLALLVQCVSLDPFLFKGERLDSYHFDSYTGETECSDAIDSLQGIPASEIRQVSLRSGSETIAGVFLCKKEKCDSTDTAIVYFHGTGPHIDYYWPRTRLLYNTGYAVFVIDYRGYGISTGKSTEDGLYEDGFSSLRFLRDSLGNPHIIVYTFSLGSLVGCEATAKDSTSRISRLVLEAPMGSVATLVADGSYLDLPSSYVTTYKGKNTEKIKAIEIPLLWLHGTKDETLNRETNGVPIWNNYPGEEGYFLRVEGAGHTIIPQTIGYADYVTIVKDFISGHASENAHLTRK
jgi:pimeloyl-ACP methyl ester carboxylesterase